MSPEKNSNPTEMRDAELDTTVGAGILPDLKTNLDRVGNDLKVSDSFGNNLVNGNDCRKGLFTTPSG